MCETFILTLDKITVGMLTCLNEKWHFKYSEEFKNNTVGYRKIIGFPHLDQKYIGNTLWPFFKIRIPGLKQPSVKEILKKENIDKDDEFALLKRFGYKCITNPYVLTYKRLD